MNSYIDLLPIGSDPRVFNQFIELKEELDKRYHPARPDINWQRVHDLCISLFNQNGIDLQTVSWFVICRQHQAGLNGLNEGLYFIQSILTQHWQTLWPIQTHTRVNILSTLSQQLISGIRGTTFVYADLPLLYQAETLLKNINNHLQILELKHHIQFEHLQNLIVTQARLLENADTLDNNFHSLNLSQKENIKDNISPISIDHTLSSAPHLKGKLASSQTYTEASFSIPSPQSLAKKDHRKTLYQGVLIGILVSSLCFFGVFHLWLSELKEDKLADVLPYISTINPQVISVINRELSNNQHIASSVNPERLQFIQYRLDELALLSPIWAQSYGLEMVSYLQEQYKEDPELISFTQLWQHNLEINASTDEKLTQWSEGMAQLDALSRRLDSFDGNPKNYITGSELKSIIFKARQHFIQGKPLEEELRLLENKPTQNTISDSDYQQIDSHFKQLLNRYALLRTK